MKFKDVFKELVLMAIAMAVVILIITLNVLTSIEVGRIVSEINATKMDVIYDSPSKILKEDEYACPECGEISWGINGTVVCRNENCPNYGLAVPVDSRD